MENQTHTGAALLQPRIVRPLPISGVADCPKCGCEKSVSRHNADWTCQAGCGFHGLNDPDREWCRCENPGPHFHPGSRGKFCAVCGKDILPNIGGDSNVKMSNLKVPEAKSDKSFHHGFEAGDKAGIRNAIRGTSQPLLQL